MLLQAPEQRFPCSPCCSPWWYRLSLCSTWGTMLEHIPALQPMEDSTPSGFMLKETEAHGYFTSEQAPGRTYCLWRGVHAGSRFLAVPVTPWGTHAAAVWFSRTARCGKDPCWSRWWRTMSHGKDPMLDQRKSMRRKEQQRLSVMNWTQPPFPCTAWRKAGRKVKTEVKLGKKWVGGKVVLGCFVLLGFVLSSSLSYSVIN